VVEGITPVIILLNRPGTKQPMHCHCGTIKIKAATGLLEREVIPDPKQNMDASPNPRNLGQDCFGMVSGFPEG
jgi:hypothetical protein